MLDIFLCRTILWCGPVPFCNCSAVCPLRAKINKQKSSSASLFFHFSLLFFTYPFFSSESQSVWFVENLSDQEWTKFFERCLKSVGHTYHQITFFLFDWGGGQESFNMSMMGWILVKMAQYAMVIWVIFKSTWILEWMSTKKWFGYPVLYKHTSSIVPFLFMCRHP